MQLLLVIELFDVDDLSVLGRRLLAPGPLDKTTSCRGSLSLGDRLGLLALCCFL